MTQNDEALLIVSRWSILRIEVDGLLNELMSLIFQLLSNSDFTSVETLSIMTVDRLWGGRPVRVEQLRVSTCEHTTEHKSMYNNDFADCTSTGIVKQVH